MQPPHSFAYHLPDISWCSQTGVIAAETLRLAKPQIFTIWPFTEKDCPLLQIKLCPPTPKDVEVLKSSVCNLCKQAKNEFHKFTEAKFHVSVFFSPIAPNLELGI